MAHGKNGNGITNTFEKASALLDAGEHRTAFACLLDLLKRDPKHGPALAAAAGAAARLGDPEGAKLLESLAAAPDDPELLYGIGFHMTGHGRPDIGISFLEACLELCPENEDVRYELGYSLFQSRRFDESAEALDGLNALSPERAVASGLLRVESLLYSGRIAEARIVLSGLRDGADRSGAGESVSAMDLMIRRLRRFDDEPPCSLREWFFVQHGAALLSESRRDEAKGRFLSLAMNSTAVGAVLRQLKTFLDHLEITPSAILSTEGEGHALALAAGGILERPVRNLAKRTGSGELLVVPDTASFQGIEEIVVDRAQVEYLFCFRIDPNSSAPVVPDVAGIMALAFRFPWQSRIEVFETSGDKPLAREIEADSRPTWEVALEITESARTLPEDGRMIEAARFYKRHRDLLVSTNGTLYPLRRAFTTFCPF